MERKFDVVVIGSGPGGYKASKLLIERGYKVCLVERAAFGGTCLNAGCIPKDILYNIAISLTRLKQLFGKEISISWEDSVRTAQERVVRLRESAKEYLQGKGLEVVHGDGELVDEKVVKVRNMKLIGDYIILACGSRQKEDGVSPEDLLTGKVKPGKKVLIKGEGPSACELAYLLHTFGIKVSLAIKDRLLSPFYQVPEFFSAKLEALFEDLGIEIVDRDVDADVDTVVTATGRIPNFCQEMFPFIRTRSDGFIDTDPYLETSMPGVYAVGDVVPPMGAGFAFEKAKVAVHNITYGKSLRFDPSKVPVVVASAYEIGFVGNLQEAVRIEHKAMTLNSKNFVNHTSGILRIGYNKDDMPVFLCGIGHGMYEILNTFSAFLGGSFSHPSYAEIIEEFTGYLSSVRRF